MAPQSGEQFRVERKGAGRYYLRLAYEILGDATWLRFVYFIVTLLSCAQATVRNSIGAGVSALGGVALCYFSVATFVGSYRGGLEESYSQKDLAGIGVVAAALCAAGIALLVWADWRITIYGLVIPGFAWASVGIVIAAITTTKKDVQPRQRFRTRRELSPEEEEKVIRDYGAVFAQEAVMDSSKLPHPKERIKQAWAFVLRRTSDPSMRTNFAAYYLGLADWQQGVGDALTEFRIAVAEADPKDDIRLSAQRITKVGGPFQRLLPLIEAERRRLLGELASLLSPDEIAEMHALIERPGQWLAKLQGSAQPVRRGDL